MIDPMVSLAFSIYSNKGVYALLLGSGISRASEIPTGWEIVTDLIQKVAQLENADCKPDPAAWYKKAHNEEPDYSKLLDAIAKTPAERQQLLRSYFEPTEDERSRGVKGPSAAHKSIAQLVAAGYLRVIVTTNFDRLTERALDEIGITPTVISNPDQITGALPLAHSGPTIIKLHGDYCDIRILNTESELANYDPGLDRLLDRVIDEYGLIVCGWSGDWDFALRKAIERSPNRRFTTYWAARSISAKARQLIEHRKAEVVKITDADYFFDNLCEKVTSLSELGSTHPLSTKLAVSMVKRYLVDPSASIKLPELVHIETERVFAVLGSEQFPIVRAQDTGIVELNRRAVQYETIVDTLLAVVTTIAFWGGGTHVEKIVKAIERIGNQSIKENSYFADLEAMRRYPSLLLVYGAGIAAIAAGDYGALASVLTKPRYFDGNQYVPLIGRFQRRPVTLGDEDDGGKRTPELLTHHLNKYFRSRFASLLPDERAFEETFDRFEHFLALCRLDMTSGGVWDCLYYNREYGDVPRIRKEIDSELLKHGQNCPYLKVGMFAGSVERMTVLQNELTRVQSNFR